MKFDRVGRAWEWLGSKCSLASSIGMRLLPMLDDGDTYYEGFGGTASVAVWLGHYRTLKSLVTETNPCIVNALNYIKQGPDVGAILNGMLKWTSDYQDQADRIAQILDGSRSEDPVKFISAMNSTRPSRGNYPYTPDKVRQRMKNVPYDLAYVQHGLKHVEIRCEPMSYRECTVAYFDPPYFNSTFDYDFQHGVGIKDWLPEIAMFKATSKLILVSDSHRAEKFYTNVGFTTVQTDKRLAGGIRGYAPGENDCYYVWDRYEQ